MTIRTPTRHADEAVSITPDDDAEFEPTRGIYVGVTGDLAVKMVNGQTATFAGLAAGVIHPLAVVKVLSTGTTAGSIIGLR